MVELRFEADYNEYATYNINMQQKQYQWNTCIYII